MTEKALATKAKIDEWNYIKFKSFLCTANKIINGVQRQPIEWEKRFANHVSDKRLIPKMNKKHIQLIKNKTGEGLPWQFSS